MHAHTHSRVYLRRDFFSALVCALLDCVYFIDVLRLFQRLSIISADKRFILSVAYVSLSQAHIRSYQSLSLSLSPFLLPSPVYLPLSLPIYLPSTLYLSLTLSLPSLLSLSPSLSLFFLLLHSLPLSLPSPLFLYLSLSHSLPPSLLPYNFHSTPYVLLSVSLFRPLSVSFSVSLYLSPRDKYVNRLKYTVRIE